MNRFERTDGTHCACGNRDCRAGSPKCPPVPACARCGTDGASAQLEEAPGTTDLLCVDCRASDDCGACGEPGCHASEALAV